MIIHFTTGAVRYVPLIDAPTRTRTRNSSLGPRRDLPLHHQGRIFESFRISAQPIEPSTHAVHCGPIPVWGSLPAPITMACRSGHPRRITYLRDAGAGINVRAASPDS